MLIDSKYVDPIPSTLAGVMICCSDQEAELIRPTVREKGVYATQMISDRTFGELGIS